MSPSLPLAVVGAHLTGQPLNHQLTELGAVLESKVVTAPRYRLFALPTDPPKPGLLRVFEVMPAIECEVWLLPLEQVGRFLSKVSAPLAIGQLELCDGRWVHGFLCEHHATEGAPDITHFGSWLRYRESLDLTSV
jgi:allophanate hydrolase